MSDIKTTRPFSELVKSYWQDMVNQAKDSLEDFRDMTQDHAVIYADETIKQAQARIKELETILDGCKEQIMPVQSYDHKDIPVCIETFKRRVKELEEQVKHNEAVWSKLMNDVAQIIKEAR